MRELDPRRDLMRKIMIAVAAALSLGTVMMATGIMAFGRGGGGRHFGGGGHFGEGGRGGGFEGGHFGRGFRGGFGGLYGIGGILPYYGYGYGSSCYALTPYGYAWICN